MCFILVFPGGINAGDLRDGVHPWVGKIPWRRPWQPNPVFLPGESPRTEEPGGLQFIGSQSQTGWKQHNTRMLDFTFFSDAQCVSVPYSSFAILSLLSTVQSIYTHKQHAWGSSTNAAISLSLSPLSQDHHYDKSSPTPTPVIDKTSKACGTLLWRGSS